MRKHLLLLFAVLSFSFINSEAMAKRVEVNTYITADNGCKFHVTGWVEVGLSWGGVQVNDYDITLDGPCGHFHFEGMVGPGSNGGVVIVNGHLTNLDTGKEEDVSASSFLGSVLVVLERDHL